jgi:hypothetical protein
MTDTVIPMTTSLTGDDQPTSRRSQLNGLKLRALVRDYLADQSVGEASPFGTGAALLHAGQGWVYLDDRPASRLGAALAWAIRSEANGLHVIAESGTGVLARRAPEFTLPISVWHAEGRALLPAVPEPFLIAPPIPNSNEAFRALIVAGGATPLVEHGVLFGETRGLEVCRVMEESETGEVRLEVGVGAHDREAFLIMHGGTPTVDSLRRVVDAVTQFRVPGAAQHPLNRLAAERLIRWQLEQTPELVGAEWLTPAQPPVKRLNLKDPVACVATGVGNDGRRVVVVCSSGVDLDVIPFAADARLSIDDGARLVVVTPARDQLQVIKKIAELLRQPSFRLAWKPVGE